MLHESAVLAITDVHYGKRTASFDTEVAQRRMQEIAARVETVIENRRAAYEFDELVLLFLGDLADGSGIYPSQGHHQEESNPEAQSVEAAELLFMPFVTRLRASVPKVRTEFVYGNHGRTGKHMHEAANWDIACYRYLSLMLRGREGIACNTENLAHPIKVIPIRGHGHLLYHGNEIKSFASIPWYGIMNRLMRWKNSMLPPWQVAHMGHFHSCGTWRINQFEMFGHGTMVTHDEWAFQVLGWESANSWWMMGVSDEKPRTWLESIETAEFVSALPGELGSGSKQDAELPAEDDFLAELRGELEA